MKTKRRFEITAYSKSQRKRIVVGWADDRETAKISVAAFALNPDWKELDIKDTRPEFMTCDKQFNIS